MLPLTFTVAQAAELCALSERQVRLLAAEAVPPSVQGRSGSGTLLLFSHFDLFKLFAIARLIALLGERDHRLSLRVAEALEGLRNHPRREVSLLVDAGGAHVVQASIVQAAAGFASAYLVLQVGVLAQELDALLARSHAALPPAVRGAPPAP